MASINIDIEAGLPSDRPPDGQPVPSQSGHKETNQNIPILQLKYGILKRLKQLANIFKRNPNSPGSAATRYIDRSIDDYPNGYPRLGAFLTTDPSHLIFRRFNYLQARVLLNLQNQLRGYESQLDSLDQLSLNPPSREAGIEVFETRARVLKDIEAKFETYIKLLNHVSFCAHRSQPPPTDFKSLENFFQNHNPLVEKEMYYLHKFDLLSLRPQEDTARVDTRLLQFLLDAPNKLTQKIFKHKEGSGRDRFMLVYSTRKVTMARAVVLGIPLLVLLVGPIYPLYHLSQREMTEGTLVGIMAIQIAFTCIFAISLKYLTRPKRHELFACSVAYMGVLLVFMSQTLQSSR